jgi:hypothetical protein
MYLPKISLTLDTKPATGIKVFEKYMVPIPTTYMGKNKLNIKTNHQFSKLDTNTMYFI